jgi:DNA-directed RNA polymerase specialized sigma24 family protein
MRSKRAPYVQLVVPGVETQARPFPHAADEAAAWGVEHLALGELARYCAEEGAKFLAGRSSNDTYAMELFRRALVERDDDAWTYLYQQFSNQVFTWIANHPGSHALNTEDRSGLVNVAFIRFWRAILPERWVRYSSLASVLTYLKCCAYSAVVDHVRGQPAHRVEVTLEEVEDRQEAASDDFVDEVLAVLANQDLWPLVWEELRGEQERVILSQIYLCDKKPREIWREYPHLFQGVQDVYRAKRNMLERLRRASALRQWRMARDTLMQRGECG